MASPWNQHCANCIGTLSFPIDFHNENMILLACVPYNTTGPPVSFPEFPATAGFYNCPVWHDGQKPMNYERQVCR